jgi:hypothetical protein
MDSRLHTPDEEVTNENVNGSNFLQAKEENKLLNDLAGIFTKSLKPDGYEHISDTDEKDIQFIKDHESFKKFKSESKMVSEKYPGKKQILLIKDPNSRNNLELTKKKYLVGDDISTYSVLIHIILKKDPISENLTIREFDEERNTLECLNISDVTLINTKRKIKNNVLLYDIKESGLERTYASFGLRKSKNPSEQNETKQEYTNVITSLVDLLLSESSLSKKVFELETQVSNLENELYEIRDQLSNDISDNNTEIIRIKQGTIGFY